MSGGKNARVPIKTVPTDPGLNVMVRELGKRIISLGRRLVGKPPRSAKARMKNVLFVSFPKSGRTWVRVMLDRLGIGLKYSHDGSGHDKQAHLSDLSADKSSYREIKIILMIRDPRDVAVSGYFQATKRRDVYEGNISDFIRDQRHGIEKILRFNQQWLAAKDVPSDFLLLSYEDFHEDPVRELGKIVRFLRIEGIGEESLEAAAKFGDFENMQVMERSGTMAERYGEVLSPGNPDDPESFKTRRGQIGGYRDYLSEADLRYCDELIERLGYRWAAPSNPDQRQGQSRAGDPDTPTLP